MRLGLAATLAALAVTVAACTSSGEDAVVDNPVVTNPPVTSTPTDTTAPPSTPVTSSPVPPSPSATPRTPSSAAAPISSPRSDTCTATALKTQLLRGGAELGKQYAAVVFTNVSRQACTLQGYPYAQLVRAGRPIGQQATHDAGRVALVRLRPGASAQADLTAVSSCNAALSDHVRVSAPGSSTTVDLPDTLRNCSLSIKAVHRS